MGPTKPDKQPGESQVGPLKLAKPRLGGANQTCQTHGPDGPQQCSGLPVQRHNAASLATLLGPQFAITSESLESHHTPGGADQQFQWITATRLS